MSVKELLLEVEVVMNAVLEWSPVHGWQVWHLGVPALRVRARLSQPLLPEALRTPPGHFEDAT